MRNRKVLIFCIGLLLFLFVGPTIIFSQTKIVSWNISDFGKTRDADEIRAIARIVKDFDIALP